MCFLISKHIDLQKIPTFNLAFVSKERIVSMEFKIVLTRSESIWKPIIVKGVVNSMIGIYVFELEREIFEFRQKFN